MSTGCERSDRDYLRGLGVKPTTPHADGDKLKVLVGAEDGKVVIELGGRCESLTLSPNRAIEIAKAIERQAKHINRGV